MFEPHFAGEGSLFRGVVDLKAASFISEHASFTFDAKEAYVSTSSRWSKNHEIAAGRRLVDWSRADREWNMGTWSPRFTLDPFEWEPVGMTGFFYGYRSQKWAVTAMVTPISVPELGIPVSEKDGKLIYASPMSVPLQDQVAVMGQLVPIKYSLAFPDAKDILLKPGVAIGSRFKDDSGFWAGGSYGYMPIHQSDLAVNAQLDAQAGVVQTDLHPRFPMHHLATAELGYDSNYWSLWGSVTGELPEQVPTPSGWLHNNIGNTLITAWGGELRWQEGLRLFASYLQVDESKTAQASSSMTIALPERYLFRRAWKAGGGWAGASPISYDFAWTFDAENSSNLVSMDVHFKPGAGRVDPGRARWSVGVGADFISTATGVGWIGQYQGNDRVRGKLTYEF
ncbi:MAG TPA: hypothetical protein VL588_04310 [Bdellovibrionota bacterium]|nr:hypothetical protein [Bdellovibrionota bacterium]